MSPRAEDLACSAPLGDHIGELTDMIEALACLPFVESP